MGFTQTRVRLSHHQKEDQSGENSHRMSRLPVTQQKKRRAERPPRIDTDATHKHRKKNRCFDELCEALVVYKAEHSDINVPANYVKDEALGVWVCKTRGSQGTKLTPEQKAKLNQLGFDWETIKEKNERKWNTMLEKLQKYRKIHLDCCVPYGWPSDPQLATWMHNQRRQEQCNKLPPHRKRLLDAMKFQWSKKTIIIRNTSAAEDEKWLQQYQELITYREEHGDCLVPRTYKERENTELAGWVLTQRKCYRDGKLKEGRKKWLDEIGFVYTVDKADPSASRTQTQWEEMCQHLEQFKKKHGHADVQKDCSKWSLGAWVDRQKCLARKGTLDQRRAVRLQEIGLAWGKSYEERWEDGFAMLTKYCKTHGHCRVPQCGPSTRWKLKKGDNGKLANWVQKQRCDQVKGVLLPERKERLDAIGFSWSLRSKSTCDEYHSDEEDEAAFSSNSEYECVTGSFGSSEGKSSTTHADFYSQRLRSVRSGKVATTKNKMIPSSALSASSERKGSTTDSEDDSDSEFEFEG